jgi:thiol:disulfide interchange protein DsbG
MCHSKKDFPVRDLKPVSIRPVRLFAGLLGAVALLLIGDLIGSHQGRPQANPTSSAAVATKGMVDAFLNSTAGRNVSVMNMFPGPFNLTGVVLARPGMSEPVVAWILPQGHGMMIGYLLDVHGNNLTAAAQQKYVNSQMMSQLGVTPGSASAPVESAADQAEDAHAAKIANFMTGNTNKLQSDPDFHGVTQGHGPMHLSVFIDPNCIYCHQFWSRLQQVPNWQDKFSVTWIPVAFRTANSAAMGAEFLAGGGSAVDANEVNFNASTETGSGILSTDPTLVQEVKDNTQNWINGMQKDLNLQPATPTVVVMNRAVMVSVPSQDLLNHLGAMATQQPAG